MPVNSAQELHDLVSTLGGQLARTHHPAAQSLWYQADQHIEHVVQHAGTWIARELEALHTDWQTHKRAIQDAENWFAHHGKMLTAVAQKPISLASTVMAGPLGQIGSGVGAASGTVGSILGTPLIPHNVLDVFRASKNHGLIDFAKHAGHVSNGVDHFFSTHGIKDFGKYAEGGGKVLAGAGVVFGGIHIANDLGVYKRQLDAGDIHGAAMTTADIAASGLKAVPTPVTYAAGVAVSLIADNIDAATRIDWKDTSYLPAISSQSLHDVYIPGAVDGLKTGLKEIWAAF